MDKEEFDEKVPMASLKQLFSFTTKRHKVYLAIGLISAIATGLTIPLFILFLSDLYSTFGEQTPPDKLMGKK